MVGFSTLQGMSAPKHHPTCQMCHCGCSPGSGIPGATCVRGSCVAASITAVADDHRPRDFDTVMMSLLSVGYKSSMGPMDHS